jgi:hypothetical protein
MDDGVRRIVGRSVAVVSTAALAAAPATAAPVGVVGAGFVVTTVVVGFVGGVVGLAVGLPIVGVVACVVTALLAAAAATSAAPAATASAGGCGLVLIRVRTVIGVVVVIIVIVIIGARIDDDGLRRHEKRHVLGAFHRGFDDGGLEDRSRVRFGRVDVLVLLRLVILDDFGGSVRILRHDRQPVRLGLGLLSLFR